MNLPPISSWGFFLQFDLSLSLVPGKLLFLQASLPAPPWSHSLCGPVSPFLVLSAWSDNIAYHCPGGCLSCSLWWLLARGSHSPGVAVATCSVFGGSQVPQWPVPGSLRLCHEADLGKVDLFNQRFLPVFPTPVPFVDHGCFRRWTSGGAGY